MKRLMIIQCLLLIGCAAEYSTDSVPYGCSVERVDGGALVRCSDGTNAVIEDGRDGSDGQDGVNGRDGSDGRDGTDGQDGQDGESGSCPQFPNLVYRVIGANADQCDKAKGKVILIAYDSHVNGHLDANDTNIQSIVICE